MAAGRAFSRRGLRRARWRAGRASQGWPCWRGTKDATMIALKVPTGGIQMR